MVRSLSTGVPRISEQEREDIHDLTSLTLSVLTTSTSFLVDDTNLGRINYVQSARLAKSPRVDTICCATQHTEACHTHTHTHGTPGPPYTIDASDLYLPSGRTVVVGTARTSHNKRPDGTARIGSGSKPLCCFKLSTSTTTRLRYMRP